jgi:hypothetical protein
LLAVAISIVLAIVARCAEARVRTIRSPAGTQNGWLPTGAFRGPSGVVGTTVGGTRSNGSLLMV